MSAKTGLRPDGFQDIPRNSSRFISNRDQLAAMQRADLIRQNTGKSAVSFQMDGITGEGILTGTLDWVRSNRVLAAYSKGTMVSIYPVIKP